MGERVSIPLARTNQLPFSPINACSASRSVTMSVIGSTGDGWEPQLVELSGVLGDRVHQDRPNSGDVGRLQRTQDRVAQHGPAEAAALECGIDGEAAEHHDRHRLRHVAAGAPRRLGLRDRPDRRA